MITTVKTLTVGLFAAAIVLTIAGCSASPSSGTAPMAMASARPSGSASAVPSTPVASSSPSATAAPAVSEVVDGPGAVMPATTEVPVASAPSPEPAATAPPVDPNAVDPAMYPSHAMDTVNGGPLPGVEFMIADGSIICGIKPDTASPGFATCTPDTWKGWLPVDPSGVAAHGVMVPSNASGPGYMAPDFYAQPARTIPVLPDGKNITLGTITCSVSGATVVCKSIYGFGFELSTITVKLLP